MNLEIVLNLEGPKMDKVWQDSAIHNLHKVASHCTITAVRFLMDLSWLSKLSQEHFGDVTLVENKL